MRLAWAVGVIQGIVTNRNFELAKQMLDASVLRQEALASNIANAETPGYRRLDLDPDFAKRLQALSDPSAIREQQALLLEDTSARTMRPDGNNVELDRELLLLNQNNVEHSFLSGFVTGQLRLLRTAITGRPNP